MGTMAYAIRTLLVLRIVSLGTSAIPAIPWKEEEMMLPEIGDTVTVEDALGLCEYFRLDYLIARIAANKWIQRLEV